MTLCENEQIFSNSKLNWFAFVNMHRVRFVKWRETLRNSDLFSIVLRAHSNSEYNLINKNTIIKLTSEILCRIFFRFSDFSREKHLIMNPFPLTSLPFFFILFIFRLISIQFTIGSHFSLFKLFLG